MKISNLIYRCFFVFIAVTGFVSCEDDEELYPQLGDDPRNISEIVSESSDLSTLSSALSDAGLDDTLRTTSTYTLFAPNNAAFEGVNVSALSEEELENVLLNHVLSTTTADFSATMTTGYLNTMATGPDGTNLSFYTNLDGGTTFNGMAGLVDGKYDIGGTNGVVHTIDAVLMPPTVVDQLKANPDFSTLVDAIEVAGLTETLSITDTENESYPFTLLAPNNMAFEGLMTELNGAFGWASLSDIPAEILTQVLTYHVVAGSNATASDVLGGELTTMQGGTVAVDADGVVSDASYTTGAVTVTDIQGVNGIVHGVDKVLLPEEVFQSVLSATLNLVDRSEDRGYSSFLAAVEKAGLSATLEGDDEFTAFVPNNAAFEGLFAETGNFESLEDFDTPEEIAVLADLLKYHLHVGLLMSSQLPDGTITTVYGDEITVDLSGDSPRLRPSFSEAIPSLITSTNIGATNGIIHEINRVLIPEGLLSALGIEVEGDGGVCPVGDPALVFFDWDENGAWWGNVGSENEPALSLDGSSYGRANFQTGGTGWQDLFWRNDASTFNGATTVGSNLGDYSLKFDINVIEPLTDGMFRIRFRDADGVDAFYDWKPWLDTGEPFTTDGGWVTVEIPLSALGVPDFSLVDAEFGMAFEGADVLLNFAIDNVRFDTPGGCSGPDPVADADLVFFDWDTYGIYWGSVGPENDPSISLDGSSYGRANFQTGGTGWQDMLWRNDATFNGAATVGSNVGDYVLKFDINTLEPLAAGMFRIRFRDADGVDAFYNWEPWNETGEAFDTEGSWKTVTIPCSVLGVPDFSLVDAEFGMAFEGADVLLNFAIDNVRFEAL